MNVFEEALAGEAIVDLLAKSPPNDFHFSSKIPLLRVSLSRYTRSVIVEFVRRRRFRHGASVGDCTMHLTTALTCFYIRTAFCLRVFWYFAFIPYIPFGIFTYHSLRAEWDWSMLMRSAIDGIDE